MQKHLLSDNNFVHAITSNHGCCSVSQLVFAAHIADVVTLTEQQPQHGLSPAILIGLILSHWCRCVHTAIEG
jgi:hypothetical protein